MSLDASLKSANALIRHRNVLTRAERLERLKDQEKWTEEKGVFNLPKVGNRKLAVGGKAEKAEATEGAATTPGTAAAATAAAPAAKGAAGAAKTAAAAPAAAGAKAAAPAAGAKKK